MGDRIILSTEIFVGAGSDRECYRHPFEPEFCVKIPHPERHPRRFRREIRFYRRLAFRGIDTLRLTRYHGTIDTNLGRGDLFDLILDFDGRIARSLEFYLDLGDAAFDAWAAEDLNDLTREFYRDWIVFHDLNPGNLLVWHLDEKRKCLVAIDGIGHNHLLPLASYSPGFARRKIARVWNRRHRQWYARYPAVLAGLEYLPTGRD